MNFIWTFGAGVIFGFGFIIGVGCFMWVTPGRNKKEKEQSALNCRIENRLQRSMEAHEDIADSVRALVIIEKEKFSMASNRQPGN